MKVHYALLAVAALLSPVFAATCDTDDFSKLPTVSCQRLSGSLNVGYDSNYVGRGLVISHSVAEGDSSEFVALKLNYDVGRKSLWSFDSTVMYKMVSSGHTLYGNPKFGPKGAVGYLMATRGMDPVQAAQTAAKMKMTEKHIREANIENEFAVVTAAKYSGTWGSISFGHDFVHGGLLGAMAKHFRSQGASVVNEAFVTPTFTPTKWLETGVTVRYSFQGIQGWWYEPYVTFKAPIIGTPEDVTVAGVLTFAMSASSNYFNEAYGACANGAQAWWIKFSTPWFVTESKNFIITPSVSFNWLGSGAQKANEVSEFRKYTGDSHSVPFRRFSVVGSVACSYVF